MPDVEVAAGVFTFRVRAVGREAQSRAKILQRMRIGVSRDESEVVIFAASESRLQSVVIRFVVVAHLIDVLQEGERRVERPGRLFGAAIGRTVIERGSGSLTS